MNTLVKLKPHNDNGEFMLVYEWLDAVNAGAYVDDDGFAHWATQEGVSVTAVYPSHVIGVAADDVVPTWATHVVWYNV